MIKLDTLKSELQSILKAAEVETASLDVRVLMQFVLGISHADFISNTDKIIPDEQAAHLRTFIDRRALGEPISKILGVKEFYGRDFKVTTDTLDPRPDTEVLIEQALKWARANNKLPRILDLGTGTGCIALTLLAELPDANAVCADISIDALKIAKDNAQKLGVEDRVTFIQSDWFQNIDESFDLIVSNPPYIPRKDIESLSKEVRNFDPILALDGGDDGLNPYKILFSEIHSHLKYGGSAFFEFGFLQSDDIARLVKESRIRMVGITPDIAGIPRVVEISTGEK